MAAVKKYILKKGITLYPFGLKAPITNENITDEIAEHLISINKADKTQFETIKTK